MRRELYARALAFRGPSDEFFAMALNLALSLMHTRRLEEAKSAALEISQRDKNHRARVYR